MIKISINIEIVDMIIERGGRQDLKGKYNRIDIDKVTALLALLSWGQIGGGRSGGWMGYRIRFVGLIVLFDIHKGIFIQVV